jgi:GNAT superfamily N-acetyltransferase
LEYSRLLSIRSANLDEHSLLNGLIHEFARCERLPVCITTDEALVRDEFGLQPKFRALIAEWDGPAVRYALFFHHDSLLQGRAVFLEDLYVRSEFRGKNIGTTLGSRCLNSAGDQLFRPTI